MNRRYRRVAALVALLGFSASFGEQLWAAGCPTDAPMAEMAKATDAADMGGTDAMGMQSVVPAAAALATVPGVSAPSDGCPLTAVMGSCTVTSFPSLAPAADFSATIESSRVFSGVRAHESMRASPLLPPPRA